jgi:hypothetical protein
MGLVAGRKGADFFGCFGLLSFTLSHVESGYEPPDDAQSHAHRVSLLVERRAQGAACQRKKGLTG